MLLAIDVGNTQTHLGAFDGDELVEHWRFQTRAGATGDELAERITGLLELSGVDFAALDRSSSRRSSRRSGPSTRRWPSAISRRRARWSGRGSRPGCRSGSTTRYEVGADRLVNAVAAYERFGGACVVVDFGTAINFDAVSADGRVPGRRDRARRRDLADGADRARRAASRGSTWPSPRAAIGKSTRGAIQSGVVYGFAGLIDGIARRIEAELGEGTPFIATGGLAAAIVPFCETIDEVDDLLTLTGLRLVWERNKELGRGALAPKPACEAAGGGRKIDSA